MEWQPSSAETESSITMLWDDVETVSAHAMLRSPDYTFYVHTDNGDVEFVVSSADGDLLLDEATKNLRPSEQ